MFFFYLSLRSGFLFGGWGEGEGWEVKVVKFDGVGREGGGGGEIKIRREGRRERREGEGGLF